MNTALITGAYGYLGSAIRRRLEADGWTTVALVRSPRLGDRAVRWTLEDGPADGTLPPARALVHAAYDLRAVTEDDLWRINVAGTRRLLEQAARDGVDRILALSSMSAYEGTRQLYGRAKLDIERITLAARGIAIRPGLVYGDNAGGMAATLGRLGRLPVVPTFGDSARQFPVREDDLCAVVSALLSREDWVPEVFGVAQTESVSFRELITYLADDGWSRRVFLPIPWRLLYGLLRAVEVVGVPMPIRADSLLGLVRPASHVPLSRGMPEVHSILDRSAISPGRKEIT